MKKSLPLPVFSSDLDIILISFINVIAVPYYESAISAGFPSPAEDYSVASINISEFVTANPSATFFVRVQGNSMIDAHITDGCLLAIDKSIVAKSGDIVVAVVNNEFTVKRLVVKGNRVFLKAENKEYQTIEITDEMNFRVWGKVVTVLNKV